MGRYLTNKEKVNFQPSAAAVNPLCSQPLDQRHKKAEKSGVVAFRDVGGGTGKEKRGVAGQNKIENGLVSDFYVNWFFMPTKILML